MLSRKDDSVSLIYMKGVSLISLYLWRRKQAWLELQLALGYELMAQI